LIDHLNAQYGIGKQLEFRRGPGGLAVVHIETAGSIGEITLHGGQVISWIPTGHEPVLWLSDSSHFDIGQSIRGGIPICWPWFGDHEKDPNLPAHGFARKSEFRVERSFELADGGCGIELGLKQSASSKHQWPHDFSLSLRIAMGASLDVGLTMHNTSSLSATYGAALHTYLRVGSAEQVTIEGLEGSDYLDKVQGFAREYQVSAPEIRGEVDRVYLDSEATCQVRDPLLKRIVRVAKSGSRTTVLWNPGATKARAMADFDDEGYRNMLCLESVNALEDRVTLTPGSRHTLGTQIDVKRI
jgi:glucose-6-phosphate 1-epimerase